MSAADNLINDPNYVPLATEAPDLIAMEDGTFIIVSSTLGSRPQNGIFGRIRSWLRTPPRQVRKGR
jgi:hypothetical protein